MSHAVINAVVHGTIQLRDHAVRARRLDLNRRSAGKHLDVVIHGKGGGVRSGVQVQAVQRFMHAGDLNHVGVNHGQVAKRIQKLASAHVEERENVSCGGASLALGCGLGY